MTEQTEARRIQIFDTTLRDGEQSPGISLNVREKLEIAEQLSRLGVDAIEAGFPFTSEGDFEAVSMIAAKVKGPAIVGLARALDADIDRAWQAIKASVRPRIHTFIACSDIHIERKLRKSKDEVLNMAGAAVERAKGYCDDVEFSPEDATRADFAYLCRMVSVAIEAGATVINIPDTVGYAVPAEFGALIAALRTEVPILKSVILSVHCHNDLGLAVANSLAAVMNGADQIECTVNGLGERAGNAAMEELVMILRTRERALGLTTGINTSEITRTSRLVSSRTGYNVQLNKAIVGANAFAHSSGIHTDGILKERTTYEIIDPKEVGLEESKVVLGKTSGRHALSSILAGLGYELTKEELDAAFSRFKELADKKSEITEADLEAIVADEVRVVEERYTLSYMSVDSATGRVPSAEVRLARTDGEIIEAQSDGDGLVDAVCAAINKATSVEPRLLSYNVSAITGGLDAQGDVSISLQIDGREYMGRGVSTDIIEASARAYLKAVNKYLAGQSTKTSSVDRQL